MEAIVYHGTDKDFDYFNEDIIDAQNGNDTYGSGIYFTTKKELAKSYGNILITAKVTYNRPYYVNFTKEPYLDFEVTEDEARDIILKYPNILTDPESTPIIDYSDVFLNENNLTEEEIIENIEFVIHKFSINRFLYLQTFFDNYKKLFREAVEEILHIDSIIIEKDPDRIYNILDAKNVEILKKERTNTND